MTKLKLNHNFKNILHRRFLRLKVIQRVENKKNGLAQWKCLCDCGNFTIVSGDALRQGRTRSCGCLGKENRIKNCKKKTEYYRSITHCPKGHSYDKKNTSYSVSGSRRCKKCLVLVTKKYYRSHLLERSQYNTLYRSKNKLRNSKQKAEELYA